MSRFDRDSSLSLWLSLLLFIGIFVWMIVKPYACQPTTGSVISAVEAQGWKDLTIHETHNYFVGWHGCSGSDSFAYEATGVNPAGQRVKLIICSGDTWTSKGVTIRTQ
jgi:hypothetical protein